MVGHSFVVGTDGLDVIVVRDPPRRCSSPATMTSVKNYYGITTLDMAVLN
jgi:hypothetical protein